jgi:magnesium-transporting ATPase (P-type)
MSTKLCRAILDALGITWGLPFSPDEKRDYLECLQQSEQKFILQHLYRELTILDGKANSTILFTSILVFGYTIIAALDAHLGMKHLSENKINWILDIGALCSLVAVFLLMWVQKLYWPSLQEYKGGKLSENLLNIRNQRTVCYRTAWCFTMISLAILAITTVYIA